MVLILFGSDRFVVSLSFLLLNFDNIFKLFLKNTHVFPIGPQTTDDKFHHLRFSYASGCLENDDLENNDLENDDSDGVARRIKGLEGYRGREIRGR